MRERGSFLFLWTVIFPFKASPIEKRQKMCLRIQGIQSSRKVTMYIQYSLFCCEMFP